MDGAEDIKPVKSESLVECWDSGLESVAVVPASRAQALYNSKSPLLPEWSHRSKRNSKQLKIVFPLCPDHLITLQQYNALRAMAVNRTLFSGILTTISECGDDIIHTVPYPARPETLPPTLLPTLLQQTVPHGDWIDMFPSAETRDRLIQAAGTFDEDDLWSDCVGGLFEGYPDDEIERRGIIAWSPPWDISGWEMTEGFMRKWGWVVRGIPGALEATNRWRRERGQHPLAWID